MNSDPSAEDPPMRVVLEAEIGDDALDQLQQTGELTIDWENIGPAPGGWSTLNGTVTLSYSGEKTDYQVRGELE